MIILGGGLTGVSAAYWLALAGIDCLVLEKHHIASGATGRNAGFILAGVAEHYSRVVTTLGREKARYLWNLSLENHSLIASLVEEEGIVCDYRKSGSYLLAISPSEFLEIQETVKLLREDHFSSVRLPEARIAEVLSLKGFSGGSFNSYDGELDPVAFVRGLASAAHRKGARFAEETPVLEVLQRDSSGVRVRTPEGIVEGEILILATNAYTPLVEPSFSDKVFPIRGQILSTTPVDARLLDGVVYADYGDRYFRQTLDGKLVIGGWRKWDEAREVGFEEETTDSIQSKLEEFLAEQFPLANVEITHRWAGIMGFSRNGLPMIGPLPGDSSCLVAIGYTGHGFGFGVRAGKILAELVVNGKSSAPLELFSPRRQSLSR
ncbi:MAG: FAD-binding oxidoreductase [Armatimonadetes bacterium]|nr:FAD-binding oxidoreductase [Armatimonadota bacterium]